MLGIAAMQSITLKNSGSAAERTQAVIEVYAMLDILRANKSNAASYNTAGYVCAEGVASNQASDNLQGWLEQVRGNVAPSACGSVNCSSTGACTVGVEWDDSRGTGDESEPQKFEISTQL
jgi:type IV pilus assembly protein PilV